MDLEALFQKPHALPTAPKVVQDLISSFDNKRISVDDVVRKLETDPILSAKLLRLANSAYYHVSHSISTVNESVTILGLVTVRSLVICSGLVNGFKSAPGLDLKQFWRYSLNTAVTAKWISQETGVNTDLAFTVGLTHGIGQLVLHSAIPNQILRIDKIISPFDGGRFDVERNSLGYDYAEVGAELTSRWKFPHAFSDAIRAFPKPLEQQPLNRLAAIIHLAAWFSRMNESNLTEDEVRTACPTEVAAKLGLAPYIMLDRMPPLTELADGMEEFLT